MKRAQEAQPNYAARQSEANATLLAMLERVRHQSNQSMKRPEDTAQPASSAAAAKPPGMSHKQHKQRSALAFALQNVVKRPEFIDMVTEELEAVGAFPL